MSDIEILAVVVLSVQCYGVVASAFFMRIDDETKGALKKWYKTGPPIGQMLFWLFWPAFVIAYYFGRGRQ